MTKLRILLAEDEEIVRQTYAMLLRDAANPSHTAIGRFDAAKGEEGLARAVADEVWIVDIGPRRLRAVTHLDVSADDCRRAAHAIDKALRALSG